MAEHENVHLVQGLYAAFGRGDIPAFFDGLADDVEADDVEWGLPYPADIPNAGTYHGKGSRADRNHAPGGRRVSAGEPDSSPLQGQYAPIGDHFVEGSTERLGSQINVGRQLFERGLLIGKGRYEGFGD